MPGIAEKEAPVPFIRSPRRLIYAITYGLLGALAVAEVGLVSQQLHNGGNLVTNYPTAEFKHDLGLLLFTCIIQLLWSMLHFRLAIIANAFVAIVVAVFWGAGAGIIFQVSPFASRTCGNPASSFSSNWAPFASQCSRIVAIEGLAWAEWALCIAMFFVIIFDVVEFKIRHKEFYSA